MAAKTTLYIAFPRDSRAAQVMARALGPLAGEVALTFAEDDGLAEAEIVVAQKLSDAELGRAGKLRWLASVAAGLDEIATPALRVRQILLTSASGVHGPNIAEHVLSMMLMFARRMPLYVRHQLAGRYQRDSRERDDAAFAELAGATLLIVGMGHIGAALARRAKAFDMRVIGVRRAAGAPPPNVDSVISLEQLDAALPEADHVCLALPLTADTHHLFDSARLARMRRSAYLYNIGRGALIDESALVAALNRGELAGAGLDVFEQEPLPASSALWQMARVILTPHVAGITPRYYDRFAPLLVENVQRYLRGEPLHNLYDPARGY